MTNNSMNSFYINEIFASINGEGLYSGELAVFVRLNGCNLRCSYCDTVYAQQFKCGGLLTSAEILQQVKSFVGIHKITLTGGEPLFADHIQELLGAFTAEGYQVGIETNGSVSLAPFLESSFSDNLYFCCDYKLPSSNEEEQMCLDNITLLRPNDTLKFVIGTEQDLQKVAVILQEFAPQCYVYLSCVFQQMSPQRVVEQMLQWASVLDLTKVRIQLQMHKYIWDPKMRGV